MSRATPLVRRRRTRGPELYLALAIALWPGGAETAQVESVARVVHVASGDRVSVELDGRRVTVSLAGVRAPPAGTHHARTAKRVLGDLVLNHEVVVSQLSEGDGEVEARLFLGRIDLSEYLVEWGYVYSLPDAPSLHALEANARRARRGLWAGFSRHEHPFGAAPAVD